MIKLVSEGLNSVESAKLFLAVLPLPQVSEGLNSVERDFPSA